MKRFRFPQDWIKSETVRGDAWSHEFAPGIMLSVFRHDDSWGKKAPWYWVLTVLRDGSHVLHSEPTMTTFRTQRLAAKSAWEAASFMARVFASIQDRPIGDDPPMKLADALGHVYGAQQCVRENTGYDKEQAREAVGYCVAETLAPALAAALEDVEEDKDLIACARFVLKRTREYRECQ